MFSDRTNMANAKLVHRLTSDFDRQSDNSTNTENIINNKKHKVHPLWDKMSLMACLVSGNLVKETFLQRQPVSLWHPGDLGRRDNIPLTSENGLITVVKGKLITFKVL